MPIKNTLATFGTILLTLATSLTQLAYATDEFKPLVHTAESPFTDDEFLSKMKERINEIPGARIYEVMPNDNAMTFAVLAITGFVGEYNVETVIQENGKIQNIPMIHTVTCGDRTLQLAMYDARDKVAKILGYEIPMEDKEYEFYCEYDWSNERETARQAYLDAYDKNQEQAD